MSQLVLVVAATTKNGIGKGGTMPWHIPTDLAYFGRVTTIAPAAHTNVVFMGRKTWESIPLKHRPLKNRINVVLSRNDDYALSSADLCHDLKTALGTFGSRKDVHRLFIIGGSSLYQQALALQADRILLTRLHNPEFDCDVFFPDVLGWTRTSHEQLCAWVGFAVPEGVQTENGVEFEFQMWIK